MFRRAIAVLVVIVVANPTPAAVVAAQCWLPPVAGVIVDPFRPPPCPYCAGNRGLEYAVGANVPIRAVQSGTVSWAGSIAGVRWVVVRHADGNRVTYGRMTSSLVRHGDRIVRGSQVGTTSEVFYFGLRVGERYVDPAPFIGRLVGRARLIPIDGSTPRRPPAPVLRCGV